MMVRCVKVIQCSFCALLLVFSLFPGTALAEVSQSESSAGQGYEDVSASGDTPIEQPSNIPMDPSSDSSIPPVDSALHEGSSESPRNSSEGSSKSLSEASPLDAYEVTLDPTSDPCQLKMILSGASLEDISNVAFQVKGASSSSWIQAYRQDDGSWKAQADSAPFGSGSVSVNAWATIGSSTTVVASASETIPAMNATVSASYDESSSRLIVSASDITGPVAAERVAVGITAPNGSSHWYSLQRQNGDVWTLAVDPGDFAWAAGTYNVTLAVANASDITVVVGTYPSTIAYGQDTCTVEVSADASTISFSTSGYLSARASNVAFQVKGASSSSWIQAYRQDDGSWKAQADSAPFGSGSVSVNAWATIGSSTTVVASASETIPAMNATVSASYDESSSRLIVSASDITGPVAAERVAVGITAPNGSSHWYSLQRQNGDVWTLAVDPGDFAWAAGTYNVTLAVANASDITVVVGTYPSTIAYGQDTCTVEVSADASTISFSTSGYLSARASNVAFQVKGDFGTAWVQARLAADGSAWQAKEGTNPYDTGILSVTVWATLEKVTVPIALGQGEIPAAEAASSLVFDPDAAMLSLSATGVSCPGGVATVAAGITTTVAGSPITHWLPLEKQDDGTWKTSVDPGDYNWTSGSYDVVMAAANVSGKAYIASRSAFPIDYGQPSVTASTDASAGTVTLNTRGGGITYASNVAFRVTADGTGPHQGVRWVQGVKEDDGSWSAVVSARDIGSGHCSAISYASIRDTTLPFATADFAIASVSGDVSASFSREHATVSPRLTNVTCTTGFSNASVAISNGSSVKWYPMTELSDGSYGCDVSIARDFAGVGGTFSATAYVGDIYGSAFRIATAPETLSVSTPIVEAVISDSRLWMSARQGFAPYASNVAFHVISSTGDQWVQGNKDGNGNWSANVSEGSIGRGSGTVTAYATYGSDTMVFKSQGFFNMDPLEADMYNRAQVYGSSTDWLILVDTSACRVGIYSGSYGNWQERAFWLCSPGAWSTPTVTGIFTVGSRGYYFDSGAARCFWYTQFYGNYLFHSTLKYPDGSPMDDRLGMNLSHGCVRLAIENAKWIYDNIPSGTTVVTY